MAKVKKSIKLVTLFDNITNFITIVKVRSDSGKSAVSNVVRRGPPCVMT